MISDPAPWQARQAGSSDSKHTRGFAEDKARAARMAGGRMERLPLMVSSSPQKAIIKFV